MEGRRPGGPDVNVSANAVYVADSGAKKPLDELNRLIALRSKALNTSTKKAAVAVAIDALKSLRSATRDARKRKRFKIKVEFTGWYGGFSWPERKPCVRTGPRRNDPKAALGGLKVKWLIKGLKRQDQRKAFLVTPEKTGKKPYIVVCADARQAREYERRASLARVGDMGGLARNALGVAMNKISQGGAELDGNSVNKVNPSDLASAWVVDSGNSCSVRVVDRLDYSSNALRGGDSAVETALMKAANKVYGILKRLGGIPLGQDLGTPFPEVKRRA